jgi:trk system potassium uptake protein TrkA
MKIVIVGCGRVGALLATRLAEEGHEVTIVDIEKTAFDHLPQNYRGETLLGNGIDIDVLRSAGLEGADAFFSLTQGDNRNIMAAQIAREIFGVRRAICKINDPIRAQTYRRRGLATWSRTTILAEILHDILAGTERDSGTLLERAHRAEAALSGDVVEEPA